MEGIELAADTTTIVSVADDDFFNTKLIPFTASTKESDHHISAVIGEMTQELKDNNLPSTAVSYFGLACSSLHRLVSAPNSPPHAIDALITILSLVLPSVSPAILKKKREFVSEIVVRVLMMNSVNPHAVSKGLKCVGRLLSIRDSVNWSDLSQLFGVLLGFITDSRFKVRKQSHECLRDVLSSFEGTSGVASASEEIVKTFERALLLAGGSNNSTVQGTKGAQEVLYILDALKRCHPFMLTKHTNTVLNRYKTLLHLRQPILTRRITDNIYVICLITNLDVSADILLDLLCSLASEASNETSVGNMTFTARMLDVGIRKVYSLNKQICAVKLPLIFSILKEILATEHEEAIFAATEALKSLINNCIDEDLVKQGVEQTVINKIGEARKSGPTIIEKICAILEGLLNYHFDLVWDMVFQVISVMFDKLGVHSSYLMREAIKSMAEMEKLSDEDFPYRKQLHECLGSALGAIGPETFLSILPLNLDADDQAGANVWLLPILKHYTVGAHLSFYIETILDMIGRLTRKSCKLDMEGRVVAARNVDAFVYSLWSLLPSFCDYAKDTAESFSDLEKEMCNALLKQCDNDVRRKERENDVRKEKHETDICDIDIRGIICSALHILIRQNKGFLEENFYPSEVENSIARQKALRYYTPQVAAENLTVIRSCAYELLTVLLQSLLKCSKDDGGCLQSTISEVASIADKVVVSKVFKRTMLKLLEVTEQATQVQSSKRPDTRQMELSLNEDQISERGRLIDIAVSLLPGLDGKETGVLFSAVKPALQDVNGLVQKKAYKALSIILQKHDGFLSSRLDELLPLMIDVLPLCHLSAKRHRLDCLYFIIDHVSKEDSEHKRHDIIKSFLTEIILALKEANKKTRNRAYDILVQIGHACGDEENGGRKESLSQFFNMVAQGLAGDTPTVVSAAVKGLARLAYEFSDLVSSAYQLLPYTFCLFQRKNREIIKANLGLLKVLVAKSQAESLQMHLGSIVEGLLKWQDDSKTHFKAKVKHLLEMLIRKCGLDAVKAVMPAEHMKLLTNIRKIKERKEKRATNSEESRSRLSKATTSRLSRWNHTNIFSDSGDEETDDSDADLTDAKTLSGRHTRASSHLKSNAASVRSKRLRKSSKGLPEEFIDQADDEPLDLLDKRKTRSALRSSENLKRKAESDDEPEIDSEGRLIIHEASKLKRDKTSKLDSDARSDTGSQLSIKSSKKNLKRQKTSASGWAYTGSEYASKKASGDVKKKDRLEPYAYWPLDRKMLSRRPEHRAAARKGMASVVKMTKKLEGKSASGALSMQLRLNSQKKGNKRKSR